MDKIKGNFKSDACSSTLHGLLFRRIVTVIS
jgi:hypothetical protein